MSGQHPRVSLALGLPLVETHQQRIVLLPLASQLLHLLQRSAQASLQALLCRLQHCHLLLARLQVPFRQVRPVQHSPLCRFGRFNFVRQAALCAVPFPARGVQGLPQRLHLLEQAQLDELTQRQALRRHHLQLLRHGSGHGQRAGEGFPAQLQLLRHACHIRLQLLAPRMRLAGILLRLGLQEGGGREGGHERGEASTSQRSHQSTAQR